MYFNMHKYIHWKRSSHCSRSFDHRTVNKYAASDLKDLMRLEKLNTSLSLNVLKKEGSQCSENKTTVPFSCLEV